MCECGQGVLPATLPALFSATLSLALWVYLWGNVGLQGLLVLGLPAPFLPHSASLGSATATQVLSAPPTGLDECLFCISLVSDFLALRFSVSSGCARRRSVSTQAAILVLPLIHRVLIDIHNNQDKFKLYSVCFLKKSTRYTTSRKDFINNYYIKVLELKWLNVSYLEH